VTWTYDPDTLETDPLMQLRLMIGDTDSTNQLAQDEELSYWLSTEGGGVVQAAIASLEALAATYSTKADRVIGPLSIKYSQISANLCTRAQGLRIDRIALGAQVYAGGIDVDDKRTGELDNGLVKPFFTRTRFDERFGTAFPSAKSPWYESNS
jgi:hypothetical protein